MKDRYLSLGFDTERPYGTLASTPQGDTFRLQQLAFIERRNAVFNRSNIPRTHFILGSYLEASEKAVGKDRLREVFDTTNPLQELQQHSFSHRPIRPLSDAKNPVMTPREFIADVQRANEVMKSVLNVVPDGLRTPYGYDRDLSDQSEILAGLQAAGITYVSSDLRASTSFDAPVTVPRQPHTYRDVGFPGMVEVPSHGFQDVVFTREKVTALLGTSTLHTPDQIIAHYRSVLERADALAVDRVSVALCLHPWAVMEYDPELRILMEIVRIARQKNFQILTYGQVAEKFRTS